MYKEPLMTFLSFLQSEDHFLALQTIASQTFEKQTPFQRETPSCSAENERKSG